MPVGNPDDFLVVSIGTGIVGTFGAIIIIIGTEKQVKKLKVK